MKNLLFVLFVAVLASGVVGLSASNALAQGAPPPAAPKMKIGGEGAFVLPTGDWGDVNNFGIGIMGRLDYMLGPKLAFTAHPGFLYHIPKTLEGLGVDLSTRQILLIGGVRYFFTPEISAGAETGFNLITNTLSDGSQSISDSSNRIPLLLGGGYSAPSGLTVGGYIFIPNFLLTDGDAGEETQIGLMVTVGYMIGR